MKIATSEQLERWSNLLTTDARLCESTIQVSLTLKKIWEDQVPEYQVTVSTDEMMGGESRFFDDSCLFLELIEKTQDLILGAVHVFWPECPVHQKLMTVSSDCENPRWECEVDKSHNAEVGSLESALKSFV